MTTYLGTPDYAHGAPARLGVLLVNLGTPDAPTTAAVRSYLAEFLWDPRVIELPRAVWWLVLHGVILRVRPRRSAHAYQKVWTPAGSPLMVESRALADALSGRLNVRLGDRVRVELAMSYSNPSIPAALERLRRDNVLRLLVLPMYPQYSATTTASIFERVTRELSRWRWLPELRMVNQYWEEDAYVAAVADSIAGHWRERGRSHLLFSFHSIPKRYFLAGDPYHCLCQATARRVAARLGLAGGEWSVGFQSRFGREEWLRPYLDQLLLEYAAKGPKRVTRLPRDARGDRHAEPRGVPRARRRGLRLRPLPQLLGAARVAVRAAGAAACPGLARARGRRRLRAPGRLACAGARDGRNGLNACSDVSSS